MCSGLLPDNVDGGFTAWILQLLRFVLIFVITSLLALFGKWTFSSCVCCRVQHIEVKKSNRFEEVDAGINFVMFCDKI